jgi:DNA modification methylase
VEVMKREETLAQKIFEVIVKKGKPLSIGEICDQLDVKKPRTTVRGRIYDNINKMFKKIARGVYWVVGDESAVMVVEGNGRDLSILEDNSIDAIVNDHPWECEANKGTNRNFVSSYEDHTFKYVLADFQEKARVLKDGAFLVEIVPEENANNYEYLFEIKQLAKKAGLLYYANVPWLKAKNRPNYLGRKASDSENILFFTKSKPRKLRKDKQRELLKGEPCFMSGTASMLPTRFEYERPGKERIHQSEKPSSLYSAILDAITLPGEVVLDQFAGSGNLGKACLEKGRFGILFEIIKENTEKIIRNLGEKAKVVSVQKFEDTEVEDNFKPKKPEQMDIFSFA